LGAGGRGGIRVETKDQEVTVAIWDTGRGISADELPHVFEPFYTTRNGGTGLGLSVAQRITAAHGGDITIESAHGTGTTVRICLPTHWRATAVA
jgi:signal transduction histidine kinase